MIGPNGIPVGIPLSEIEAYSRMFGFDTMRAKEDLVIYVRACDNVWLEEMDKRRPSG